MKKAVYLVLVVLLGAAGCTEKCDPINGELTGRWERVDGNNSPFNGMVVEFAGSTGTLKTIPTTATGFNLQDAKWRNVVKEKDGVFSIEDRDSAGAYVKSRIFILADGKEIMLSSIGGQTGNYQKWKRL